MYPHQESNLDLQLRRLLLYPLSYGGLALKYFQKIHSKKFFKNVGYAGFEPATIGLRGRCSTN